MDLPIVYALACLVTALLVVVVLKLLGITDSVTIVAVLLSPIIIWAMNSEIVKKISAGGVILEFREDVVREPVKKYKLSDITVSTQEIQKEGLSDLYAKIAAIEPGCPLSLMIDIDRTGYYRTEIILPYLEALVIYDPDATAILVNSQKRFIGSAPANRVIAFLATPDELNTPDGILQTRHANQQTMTAAISSGQERQWLSMPGFTRLSINSSQSNLDALVLMDKARLKSVIIVNEATQPVGIAQRDAIVAHLVSELASPKKDVPSEN